MHVLELQTRVLMLKLDSPCTLDQKNVYRLWSQLYVCQM